jgi:hypothetical protein
MGTLVQLLLTSLTFKVDLVSQSFTELRFVSLHFVSLIFAKMTFSRNTKFRENALYFREITKLVSLPFRENFAKRNSVKNPICVYVHFHLDAHFHGQFLCSSSYNMFHNMFIQFLRVEWRHGLEE